jgi:hypothetical protein
LRAGSARHKTYHETIAHTPCHNGQAMTITKNAAGAALALIVGLLTCWAGTPRPASDAGDLMTRVDQRIRDWQPTAAERRFDAIGWAKDIRDALRLARMHSRPVFLFTYDGASLATYRC